MTSAATAAGKRIALITGANKGIGYGIVSKLAEQPDLYIILACRDKKLGEEAIESLKRQNKHNVTLLLMDVSDKESVLQASAVVKKQFGTIHILVNNAAIYIRNGDYPTALQTIRTNYYGVLYVSEAFFPLLNKGARVVQITSTLGTRAFEAMNIQLKHRLVHPDLTIPQLTSLVEEYLSDMKNGNSVAKGWPANDAYGHSKAFVNALTVIQNRNNKTEGVLINSCCPGWVKTDLGGESAMLTISQGIETPVLLSLLPDNSPSGKFWKNGKVSDSHNSNL